MILHHGENFSLCAIEVESTYKFEAVVKKKKRIAFNFKNSKIKNFLIHKLFLSFFPARK